MWQRCDVRPSGFLPVGTPDLGSLAGSDPAEGRGGAGHDRVGAHQRRDDPETSAADTAADSQPDEDSPTRARRAYKQRD